MKILIYGTGVLGSHLAHVLCAAGHDVTALARGDRLSFLIEEGIKIRHYLQLKTTTDRVSVTDRFDKNDKYDLVFVVMQYQQTFDILENIAENTATENFAFIGNNPLPEKTYELLNKKSKTKKNIYFGFFMAAGQIKDNLVICAHTGGANSGSLVIGALGGESLDIFYGLKGKLKLDVRKDIGSWLKCHAIFVLPVCFAIYACGGELKRANRKMNFDILDAVSEGYDLIRSLGCIPDPPEDERLVKKRRIAAYAFLKFCALTPVGRLMTSAHAMSAKDEIRALDRAVVELRKESPLNMKKWDALRKHMI